MKIEQKNIKIRDVVEGYSDRKEEGVIGYGGKLDIRPSFQREFVYEGKQKRAVIQSIIKGYPLNVMYWVKREDEFEILDGQQRTISIGMFVQKDFAIRINGRDKYFHNLSKDLQNKILDYELTVYFCEGTDDETLEWFEIVNIAGEELRPQELRNAIYGGSWIESAKRYFSKPRSAAEGVGRQYLNGKAIRQDYLETAIDWYSDGDIVGAMAKHQHEPNATELWDYFNAVLDWVKFVFPMYHKTMKGINWGRLYKDFQYNYKLPKDNAKEVLRLLSDEDVTNKRGIYAYILSGKEHLLNIRQFSDSDKQTRYEKQKGICPHCSEKFNIAEMEGDHIKPWSKGGKSIFRNLQMLCRQCNRTKGSK